jgi:cell division transport system ATP-binding protein
MQLFKRLNDVGVTVVVATHDVHLIERFDLKRVVLDHGRTETVPAGALRG